MTGNTRIHLLILLAVIIIATLLGLLLFHVFATRDNTTESATYTIQGDHSGTIIFFSDGTGYAIIDNHQTNEFHWQMNNGIGYGYIKGTVTYWGNKIPITLFTENLTIISPEFPGSYAIKDGSVT
jgi:hypothetical protein